MSIINIPLTKGYSVIIDSEDYHLVSETKWQANVKNKKVYASRNKRYGPRIENKSKCIYMHRLIINAGPKDYVDHINGNTLDNRKENLRICTNKQNAQNHPGQPDQRKYSKFKGVKKATNHTGFSARIIVDGKSLYLGYFKTEIEAAKAYNEAALKYFGEFAWLNLI